jgi:hypothetical protein
MSKNVLTTTLAAIACAAVVTAQEPQTPQAPAPPSQPPAAAQPAPDSKLAPADNLTVTGCLERQPEAASARPGAVGTAGRVEAPAFILTKVMKPTGTAGSSSAAPAPTTYRLDAEDSKLSAHVGQKVEITGMLAGRPAERDASKGGISSAPQLKVENVKMIASTCTE